MKKNYRGLFVTLEGADKTGKSTYVEKLAERLQDLPVVTTFEPGGTPIGQLLRRLLFEYKGLSKATELLLFNADRAQHYKEVIRPALKDGKIILCDRYFDSTLVYQGTLNKWNTGVLYRLHGISTGCLLPDVTYVCHGSVGNLGEDRYDNFDQELVQAQFVHLTTQGKRYRVIRNENSQKDNLDRMEREIRTAFKYRQGV